MCTRSATGHAEFTYYAELSELSRESERCRRIKRAGLVTKTSPKTLLMYWRSMQLLHFANNKSTPNSSAIDTPSVVAAITSEDPSQRRPGHHVIVTPLNRCTIMALFRDCSPQRPHRSQSGALGVRYSGTVS